MKKLALVLLFASMNSMAADIKSLYITFDNNGKSCYMTEFGNGVTANPIKFNGNYLDKDHCSIHFDKVEFSKKFDFCALSGVQNFNPQERVRCEVTYSDEWVEFSQHGDNDCEFACKMKSPK